MIQARAGDLTILWERFWTYWDSGPFRQSSGDCFSVRFPGRHLRRGIILMNVATNTTYQIPAKVH
jgi:hypothetical protein